MLISAEQIEFRFHSRFDECEYNTEFVLVSPLTHLNRFETNDAFPILRLAFVEAIDVYVCQRVCVCMRARTHTHIHTYTYVCACLCARARKHVDCMHTNTHA